MLLAPPAAPAVPSAVTTSPYRLATPHGPRDWQGRAPAHTLPPPDWVPARDCASGPASLPFVRRGRVRTSRSPAWLGPAPAEPPRPSPSHGAGAAVASSSPSPPPAPQCAHPRGGGRETRRGPRPRLVGAASPPAGPVLSRPPRPSPPAAPGLPRPPVRGGARELGPVPRARRPAGVRPGPIGAPSSRGAAPAGRGGHHPGAGSGRPCPGSHWTAARSKLSAHVAWPPEVATA